MPCDRSEVRRLFVVLLLDISVMGLLISARARAGGFGLHVYWDGCTASLGRYRIFVMVGVTSRHLLVYWTGLSLLEPEVFLVILCFCSVSELLQGLRESS